MIASNLFLREVHAQQFCIWGYAGFEVVITPAPKVVRSPIVRSGKAQPPSSVTATMLGLFNSSKPFP